MAICLIASPTRGLSGMTRGALLAPRFGVVILGLPRNVELMTHITEYERVGFRKTSLFDEAHRAKANGLVDSLGQVSVIRLQRYDRSRPVCTSDDEMKRELWLPSIALILVLEPFFAHHLIRFFVFDRPIP